MSNNNPSSLLSENFYSAGNIKSRAAWLRATPSFSDVFLFFRDLISSGRRTFGVPLRALAAAVLIVSVLWSVAPAYGHGDPTDTEPDNPILTPGNEEIKVGWTGPHDVDYRWFQLRWGVKDTWAPNWPSSEWFEGTLHQYREEDGTLSEVIFGTYTITGLTNGIEYEVQLQASNEEGCPSPAVCNWAVSIPKYVAPVSPPLPPSVDEMPSFGGLSVEDKSWKWNLPIEPFILPQASGGDGPLKHTLSPQLPAGLVYDGGEREISGTPSELLEETEYTYTVRDEDGDTDAITFTIMIFGGTTAEEAYTNNDEANMEGFVRSAKNELEKAAAAAPGELSALHEEMREEGRWMHESVYLIIVDPSGKVENHGLYASLHGDSIGGIQTVEDLLTGLGGGGDVFCTEYVHYADGSSRWSCAAEYTSSPDSGEKSVVIGGFDHAAVGGEDEDSEGGCAVSGVGEGSGSAVFSLFLTVFSLCAALGFRAKTGRR